MNKFKLLTALSMMITSFSTFAAQPVSDLYQESYALYALYHPDNKSQSTKALMTQYSQDYADLFKQSKQINLDQYIAYEQARITDLMKQRREMSLKQTYVRYGILDADKNQKMTLKEFQASGMRTFDEMDKNKDGLINEQDIKLASKDASTHDGFKVRLPIAMPMANTAEEFIQKYGNAKSYVTLGDYLTSRDQQFMHTDSNKDFIVTEQEYVNEFMQRYDENTVQGIEKMKGISQRQFQAMAQKKNMITAKDIAKFAKDLDKKISQ